MIGTQQIETQSAPIETNNISFETVSNLYLSAMATEQASSNAGSGYPNLSEVATIYQQYAGTDGVINSEAELQDLLNALEQKTGVKDLFDFDANAAGSKKGIDENGVLLDGTCPVTGYKECYCKVTDGFKDITEFFKSLANDTTEELNNSVLNDGKLETTEESELIDDYLIAVNKTKGEKDIDLTRNDFGLATVKPI